MKYNNNVFTIDNGNDGKDVNNLPSDVMKRDNLSRILWLFWATILLLGIQLQVIVFNKNERFLSIYILIWALLMFVTARYLRTLPVEGNSRLKRTSQVQSEKNQGAAKDRKG